jgi:hypothetical protein
MQSIRYLGILAVLFVGHLALTQEAGSIRGKVTDSSGAPLLGAVVRIEAGDGTSRVASGLVTQVSAGNTPDVVGSVALHDVTLRASNMSVPLRSNQVRGVATPVAYQELPGTGKVEVTLFVAQTVKFPGE